MVKTRRKPDIEESPGVDFISLRGRSSKRRALSESEENDDGNSEDDMTPQSKRQRVTIRGRGSRSLGSRTPADLPQRRRSQVVEETPVSLSPRKTRSISTGKKYLNHKNYEEKEEEHEDEDEDDEEEEDDEVVITPRSKKGRPGRFRGDDEEAPVTSPRGRRKSKQLEDEHDDDHDNDDHDNDSEDHEEEEEDREVRSSRKGPGRGRGRGRGRPAKRKPFLEESIDDDDDEHDEDFQPRRSTRERKMIYSTMDQRLLGSYYSTDVLLSGGADVSPPVSSARRKGKGKGKKGKDELTEEEEEEEETKSTRSDRSGVDMYSRIKNRRIAQQQEEENEDEDDSDDDSDSDEDSDDDSDDSDDTSSSEEESSDEEVRKKYPLRRQRRPPDRFEASIEEPIPRRLKNSLFDQALSPFRRRMTAQVNSLTPTRSPRFGRRYSSKHAAHHSSSTSSSSDDERGFERRKKKSMAKARMRLLPMNLKPEDVNSGVIKDRQKIGSSLADVDPMNIDTDVTFESVGGLGRHLQSLKEMIVFPLLYPEVFERFKITPPRGCLFHGPPGTGKTLVARALANECRQGDKRVAFFMRKGADCLSKWVGESERQLRLLFDQAFQMRPSIIFFDEIDGLAPVRSSRQDQIHSSIVSTLLALMDGLDNRGEIVVIGATNRIDSIDPALRRPGRFDREFLFPLPSCTARQSILTIHTKDWEPKLSENFISEVAEKCVGYCGADMKALCTEAGLSALRHQFPQIYASKEKLKLDLSRIKVNARDFKNAMQTIVPAAQRAVVSPGRSLSITLKPLLHNQFLIALDVVKRLVPEELYSTSKHEDQGNSGSNMVMAMLNEDDFSDEEEEEEGPSIFANPPTNKSGHRRRILSEIESGGRSGPIMKFSCAAYNKPSTHRPRLLIDGNVGQGQSSHLAPAILHHLERLPVYCLDLAALYAVSATSPEESCAQVFREARRTSPSIIYMPHIAQWWDATAETTRATFLTLLQDLPPTAPVLVLATSDSLLRELPVELQVLFGSFYGDVVTMRQPNEQERREFFEDLILVQAAKVPVKKKRAAAVALQVLEPAPPPEPRKLTEAEEKNLQEKEERTLRELRLFLRDVLSRLATEKKFGVFAKPVDPEEVPDYGEVIENPMDLSTMMNKINMHKYVKAREFLDDIELIARNALEYNPDRHPEDRIIRNRACELKDTAYAIVQTEMDSDFEVLCAEIEESRNKRGDSPAKTAPQFYRVLPKDMAAGNTTALAQTYNVNYPTRFSRRSLGMESEQLSAAEEAMLYASCRPLEKKKPKPKRRMRSRWSRGFVPLKPTKKKPAKSEVETEEDKEEKEGEKEEEEEKEEIVENGVLDEEEKMEEDTAGATKDSVQENCVDDTTSKNETMLNNHCSDNESVKSGEVQRRTRHSSGRRSRIGSQSESSQQMSRTRSPVVTPPPITRGRRSRGSSPRVPEASPSTETVNNKENEKALPNGLDDNGVSEDAQTSSLDPPSDNETTQEKNDRSEQMETEEVGGDKEEEKEGQEENQETEPSPEKRMLTRRMIADKEADRAREILEASLPKLIVDKNRLESLLDTIVMKTSSFNIERLERLHCSLSQCIYLHRKQYDKTQLIQDMEAEVDRVTKI